MTTNEQWPSVPGGPEPVPGQHPGGPPGAPPPTAGAPTQPAGRPGRRQVVIGALVVVALCLGLCGVGQFVTNLINADDWEGLGQPVPASSLPVDLKPTWQRPNDFVPGARVDPPIRYQLETWVLASAGKREPMTSRCAKTAVGEIPPFLGCTVTFAGQPVDYEVSLTDLGKGVFEWKATARQTVVTRAGLLALVDRRYGSGATGWSDLRCEEFPEISTVPVGQPLPQRCYAKRDGDIKTARITLTPGDQGEPALETQLQEEGLR